MAAETLRQVTEILGMYQPRPWYYLARSLEKLGWSGEARRAMRRARQLAKVFPFPHPIVVPLERILVRDHLEGVVLKPWEQFDIYGRYREAMAEVAAEMGVAFLQVDERKLERSDFTDYCHLTPRGYEKLVEELLVWLRKEDLLEPTIP